MMHVDWQTLVVFIIVALAAWSVGRRLWNQVGAFRSRPRRAAPRPGAPRPTSSPLIQVQLRPPAHLKRPSADDK